MRLPLIAREKLMPKLFVEGKANLKNPPRIYTEVAIEQVLDIVGFFETTMFRWHSKVSKTRRFSMSSGRRMRMSSF